MNASTQKQIADLIQSAIHFAQMDPQTAPWLDDEQLLEIAIEAWRVARLGEL